MKKGRFTRPLRLSRNYSFADKQERPWAVPKSSESSYTETFSLQKYKKPNAILARLLGRAAWHMSPDFWNLHGKFY